MDKRINIGVNKQEYDSVMRTVSDDAKKMASEMIRSAREQESSSRDVVRSINEQVRALREKYTILQQINRAEVEQGRTSGELTDKEYKSRLGDLRADKSRDDAQLRELRNIFDAINSTSKQEIHEDKKESEKQINTLRQSGTLGRGKDEIENLKQITRDSIINSKREQTYQQSQFGMSPLSAFNVGQGVGGGSAMGLLGLLGGSGAMRLLANPYISIPGAVAAVTAGAVFKGDDIISEKMRQYMQVSGSGNISTASQMAIDRNRGFGQSMVDMGYDPMDSWDIEARMKRSYGGRRISNSNLINSMAITGSRDVSQQMIEDIFGTSRYSRNGQQNPEFIFGNMENFLKEIKRPIAQLPELINQYLQSSNQILMSQGSVNSQGLQNLIGGVTESYGVEGVNVGRYTRAASFLGSGQNRIAGMSNLQIRAARKVLGKDVSMWEIGLMRDDPSHPRYQEYYKTLTDEMSNMRGGGEGAKWTMFNAFGGTLGKRDIEGMYGKGYKIQDLAGGENFMEIYQKNATDMTSVMQDWKKEVANYLKTISITLGQILQGQR